MISILNRLLMFLSARYTTEQLILVAFKTVGQEKPLSPTHISQVLEVPQPILSATLESLTEKGMLRRIFLDDPCTSVGDRKPYYVLNKSKKILRHL